MSNRSELEQVRADAATEHKNMLSCGYELFCVYMQLATSDKALEKGIVPGTDNEPDTLKYQDAYRYLTTKIKRLEFMWCDPPQMDITYFPLCKQSAALTVPSKERLRDAIDISTPDAKKRDFLIKGQALVDEMFYLYKLQQFPPFFWLQSMYPVLRYGVFGMVVILNFLLAITVQGPGNQGREGGADDLEYEYDAISIRPVAKNSVISGLSAKMLITIIAMVVIVMYAMCL